MTTTPLLTVAEMAAAPDLFRATSPQADLAAAIAINFTDNASNA